jgi:hypothetical protein
MLTNNLDRSIPKPDEGCEEQQHAMSPILAADVEVFVKEGW